MLIQKLHVAVQLGRSVGFRGNHWFPTSVVGKLLVSKEQDLSCTFDKRNIVQFIYQKYVTTWESRKRKKNTGHKHSIMWTQFVLSVHAKNNHNSRNGLFRTKYIFLENVNKILLKYYEVRNEQQIFITMKLKNIRKNL